ncbi:pregnancy-specific glycoprotein 22-like [Lissotriton helveticus]
MMMRALLSNQRCGRNGSLQWFTLTAWLSVWILVTAGLGSRAEVVNAVAGQTAGLTAPVPANILVVSWFRGTAVADAQRIVTYIVPTSIQNNGARSTGRESVGHDGSLWIRDLRTSDSGYYTVHVIPYVGLPSMVTRQLRVYDGPHRSL